MLLSIISITKDNIEGLKKTISSVFSQSFLDFEYIIVDGASLDGSVDYLLSLEDNPIAFSFQWISESDTGVYHAMNKGIGLSKGEYLLFLNAGDYLVNSTVLSDVFSSPKMADILYGRCNISKGNKIVYTTNPPDHLTFATIYNEGLAHQATFIKHQLFEMFGLYDESYRYNADIEFWYRTIVLEQVSTQKLDFVISDYNLDGISSTDNQTTLYKEEMDRIYSHPTLKFYLPDYNLWKYERQSMEMYYWVKQKKLLQALLKLIYYMALFFNTKVRIPRF
jgi:glycosyltransferase involved in cell wall biosynthesis